MPLDLGALINERFQELIARQEVCRAVVERFVVPPLPVRGNEGEFFEIGIPTEVLEQFEI